MKKRPLVSIIIPTYRRTAWLREALDSVAAQTFSDYEVLVMDDGTPGVENAALCSNYPFVRYFKLANSGGPIVPRNRGLQEARGELVAFLDDDDRWLPDKLQRQVEVLKAHPDCGLVHGYCYVMDGEGKPTGRVTGQLHADRKHGYVFDDMVGDFTVMLSSPLIRKALIDRVGGFNTAMQAAGEDVEFFYRLAFHARFYFINAPLLYYREHSGGISHNNRAYLQLPGHLYKVLRHLKGEGLLAPSRFRRLRAKLLRMQITGIRSWSMLLPALWACILMYPGFLVVPGLARRLAGKNMELLRQSLNLQHA